MKQPDQPSHNVAQQQPELPQPTKTGPSQSATPAAPATPIPSQPASPNESPARRSAIGPVVGCVVVVTLLVYGCNLILGIVFTAVRPVDSGATATMTEYESLHTGMSYGQACRVIGGKGRELSSSDVMNLRTVMYAWDGEGSLGANMTAMFQNDRLISKAQFGLR